MASKIVYRTLSQIVGCLTIAFLLALPLAGCKTLYEQHTQQIPVLTTNAVSGAVTTNLVPVVLLTPSPAAQTLPATGALLGPWGELGAALGAAGIATYAAWRNRKTMAALDTHIFQTQSRKSVKE